MVADPLLDHRLWRRPVLDAWVHSSGEFPGLAILTLLAVIGLAGPFVRLALENRHAKPDVVTALLRAGMDQEPDQRYLLGSINDWLEAASGAVITAWNERSRRAMLDAGVDLNHQDLGDNPRFFLAPKWPEGLAILASIDVSLAHWRTPRSLRPRRPRSAEHGAGKSGSACTTKYRWSSPG